MSKYDINVICTFLHGATESQLREFKVPFLENQADLDAVIKTLAERKHDYGTCVYAMSIAATAAFDYIAHVLGTTGFQSGVASMDVIRRTRSIDGPFAIVVADKMLYPQYDILSDVQGYLENWEPWAADEARKRLAELGDDGMVSPRVKKRWETLSAKHPPKEAK